MSGNNVKRIDELTVRTSLDGTEIFPAVHSINSSVSVSTVGITTSAFADYIVQSNQVSVLIESAVSTAIITGDIATSASVSSMITSQITAGDFLSSASIQSVISEFVTSASIASRTAALIAAEDAVTSASIASRITAAIAGGDFLSSASVQSVISEFVTSASIASRITAAITAGDFLSSASIAALGYITETSANAAYQAAGDYPTSASVSTMISGQLTALSFLTEASADAKYQLIGDYVTSASLVTALTPYLTSASAASTYQPTGDYVTSANVATVYAAQVSVVSQAEAEAGTGTDVRRWTPERVKQAIDANIPAASGQLLETIIYSCPSQTVTISNANPALVTTVAQNRPEDGCPVRFTTTGTLPAGLSTGVTYWVVNSSGTTFNVAATKGGTAIATTDAGSGTHTCLNAPYEKATNNPSFIEVTVVGGSGGMNNSGTNGAGAGAGGALKIIQNADLSASETVTSGAAGTNSANGGTSSFGSHCSATGGESGTTTTPDGGEGTGGDINVRGMGAQVNPRYGAMSAFGLSRGAGDDIDSNLNGEQGLVIVREYS